MKKPWFGRKIIGWGWGLPQTWQGWITLIIFLVSVFIITRTTRHFLPLFFILLICALIIFIKVIWITSGPPGWGTLWKPKKK